MNPAIRHSLRGECGLKYLSVIIRESHGMSLSARRVWIEIFYGGESVNPNYVTLCEESVD